MRHFLFLSALAFFSTSLSAQWTKIQDADYVWGPFKIYNISLFSESGEYVQGTRPLMLTLKYAKPVDGRDFAISLARSWSNLGITLPNQDEVVDRLRKIMPNIRDNDVLSYIALEETGYFVLNDVIIPAEFNKDFNDAVVAVWLDPRVEIGRKLLYGKQTETQRVVVNTPKAVDSTENTPKQVNEENAKSVEPEKVSEKDATAGEQAGQKEQNSAKPEQKEEHTKSPEYTDPEIEVLPPYDPLPQVTWVMA